MKMAFGNKLCPELETWTHDAEARNPVSSVSSEKSILFSLGLEVSYLKLDIHLPISLVLVKHKRFYFFTYLHTNYVIKS